MFIDIAICHSLVLAGQSFAYGFDDIGNRTETTHDGDIAVYTANLLNQYEERDIPGRVRLMGSALPEAIITVNNEQTTRQQDGDFHWSQAVSNTNSAAYPGVSILAVLQGAGTNGADIVATETGRVFVAESPEIFTYDLDGNLLTDGRWTNTWDGENRLIRVETRPDLPGEVPRVRADFTYDGQGRRIQEQRYQHDGTSWVSTASTRFLYDGWLLLAAVDDFDAFTRTYTWGLDLSGSMQGAGGVGGLLAMHQGGSDYAYAYDGNGNVIALIATDGTTTANYEYGPFGEPLRATGPAANANRFRFSTKWEDQDTGWLYYGYRWLDPGTGRWLNRDPIEESGGLNLYAFVRNSSIGKWDALGLVAGQFQFDGVRIAPVGPRAYANAPASLTENSCRCTRRLFTCKYRLRCELSVRASINVNPSTHRVWDDRYDELIGDVLAHEHRHIANHRAWYDAQKAWTAIREVDYDDQSTCEAMGLTVVRVTEERWRRHYQREIDHVGPNWP